MLPAATNPPIRETRASRATLTVKTIGTFALLDVLFKIVIVPGFADLFGIGETMERSGVLRVIIGVSVPLSILWLACLFLLVRSVDRETSAAGGPLDLEAAGLRAQRLPNRATLAWAAQWCLLVAAVVTLNGGPASLTAMGFFVAALAIGPFPLAHSLVVWLTAPILGRLSVRARERGVNFQLPRRTLRRRLAGYCLCMCVAPTSYMASVAFTARAPTVPYGDLLGTVLLYFGAVGAFAVLCALLVAAAITGPVGEMSGVVRTIIREGEVSHAGRLPHHQRDELGVLAELTNEMIDRLAQTAAERTAMRESLEALNSTLEQRVEERTARLSQSNAKLAAEMNARALVEVELRQAQKLEAVGRLAGGIAHEINTPVQFISDNVQFVRDALKDLTDLVQRLRVVNQSVLDGAPSREAAVHAAEAGVEGDVEYVLEHVPPALDQSMEGLGRIATIVRSMKQFAHADQKEMRAIDLNQSILATLTISKSEYKYVAEVSTDLGELPLVLCHAGDINQVVLNIIINAAHAISSAAPPSGIGKIEVRTRLDGECVVISIGDTGGGVPEAIQHRIFDPFFTTKEVGKGIGQGLAVARSVVEKHGGELTFESEPCKGATFHMRLPIDGRARALKAVAA